METKEKMMVFAYGIYLDTEKDLSYTTRNSYRQEAVNYYENPGEHDKPKYLDEAEEIIGFKQK